MQRCKFSVPPQRNKTRELASVLQCLETASQAARASATSGSFRVIVLRLKLAVNDDAARGRSRVRGGARADTKPTSEDVAAVARLRDRRSRRPYLSNIRQRIGEARAPIVVMN